ncbi:LOB domain-containing protein [Actinidia chinensis var. chinensis]|uniref:LOB domain-containing protein n=1 Tax=Actinidia chinensis var. chinensis TaxID=1590841 RepID=A0A2R6P9G8_ACTCC|nr:LOB domain-containing protein [Actinidia chinensis var. chinensis]
MSNMTVKGGTSQACAACKYQRRKCADDCPLAPYFPASQPKTFQNAHRLFGVCNMMKILRQLETQEQKDEAMKSVLYESNIREKFPVYGCCGVIRNLYCQLVQAIEELKYVHVRLAMCGEEWHNHQIVDHHYALGPELQFGVNCSSDALAMLHQPFEANPLVATGNNEDIAKSYWGPLVNYNTHNNNSIPIQAQFIPSPSFPDQQETEVLDYDDILFDTMADDRQSYIESKEACESSCELSWKNNAQPVELASKNDIKSAAACFGLVSTN